MHLYQEHLSITGSHIYSCGAIFLLALHETSSSVKKNCAKFMKNVH